MAGQDETNAAAASSSEGYSSTTTDAGRSAAVAATAADAGRAAVATVKKENLMSKREIRWFLNRKPRPAPSHYEALRRSNPDLTPQPAVTGEEVDEDTKRLYRMAKMFYESEERHLKMQEWVRGEMETKGYVEMDDDLVRRRAQAQAVVEEGWKKIEELLESETEDDDDDDDSSDDYSSDEDDDGYAGFQI